MLGVGSNDVGAIGPGVGTIELRRDGSKIESSKVEILVKISLVLDRFKDNLLSLIYCKIKLASFLFGRMD